MSISLPELIGIIAVFLLGYLARMADEYINKRK